jgi:tetratricopeptide (TPR) repeat protein
MRMAADEAIRLGWPDIVAWTRLTETEKAWRRAHHAAGAGDLDGLVAELGTLPPTGYHARLDLLLPHLPAVFGHAPCRALVESWRAAGLPGADTAHRLLEGSWLDAIGAGVEMLAVAAPARVETWSAGQAGLAAGAPGAPLRAGCPAWDAAAVITRARGGANVDQEFPRIAAVAPSILDDLVDAGALTAGLAPEPSGRPHRPHLVARLRPEELDDATVGELGHATELARRYCRRGDRARLAALPEWPGVVHYQALLEVIEGRAPDRSRLRPESVELLELAGRALGALRARTTSSLPGPVIDDPTLWAMFAEEARSGHLQPDAEVRAATPQFGQWADLQRLVGLLWQERWADAVALGEKLTSGLDAERQEDEALSLTAYALVRLGRADEAIALLERAMAGSYTEALLVNLTVVASVAKPEVAATHFARIVNEAPNRELQIAALRRAVQVWNTAADMPTFPPELVEPLRVVLSGECSVDDYATFAALAANVAPDVMLKVTNPGGERDAIFSLQRARARFIRDDDFGMKDLAGEFVAVHKNVGRPAWFDHQWEDMLAFVRESVFVPWGEAGGFAVFIDSIHVGSPDLLNQFDRFLLLPQAGGHIAAIGVKHDDVLSPEAMKKFFYRPIEEFLAERSKLDPGAVDLLADNFHRALFIAAGNYMQVMRAKTTEPYNALTGRLGWDTQNRFAIIRQMRAILDEDAANQEEVDRALDRLRRLAVDSDDGRERTRVLDKGLSGWRDETIRLRANL